MHKVAPFIGSWGLSPAICDALLKEWEIGDKQPGTVSNEFGETIIKPETKASTDVYINADNPVYVEYITKHILPCLAEYKAEYPACDDTAAWTTYQDASIQFYKPGEGFKKWHCERSSAQLPAATRHLVFMTYLNDVTDQGGTEFKHQEIIVTPEKGKTLIWPADWTFTHRGVPSPTQDKFIITGWFNFI